MSISKMTVLAFLAGLTMSFSALPGQGPASAKKSGCCQKASSKAQPLAQELSKKGKGCCEIAAAKQKGGSCGATLLLTDAPMQTGSSKKTSVKTVMVTTKAVSAGQLNSHCYFSKKLMTADSPLIAYNGFAIRVCCKGCVRKFAKLTSRVKDSYIATLVTPVNKNCPLSGKTVKTNAPSVTYKGNFVKLCCKGCLGKWEKADEQKRATLHARLSGSSADKVVDRGQQLTGIKKGAPQACCVATEPCADCKKKTLKK